MYLESFKHWLYILDLCEAGYPLDGIDHLPRDQYKFNALINELRNLIAVERERIIN